MPIEILFCITLFLLSSGIIGVAIAIENKSINTFIVCFLILACGITNIFWICKADYPYTTSELKIVQHEKSEYVLMPGQTDLTNLTQITGKFYNKETIKITHRISGWNTGLYFSPSFPKIISVDDSNTIEPKKEQ